MRTLLLPLAALLGAGAVLPAADDAKVPDWAKGITVIYTLEDVGNWQAMASDPSVWKLGKDEAGQSFLELAYDRKAYKSSYTPKHRSPVHIALLGSSKFSDFVMDLEMQSTTEPYGHQDLCVFFGFQSPEKFYYAHLAPAPDANAHNVFVVNDAPRKNLLEPQKKGVEWKKGTWHKVRLVRQATTGLIEVYFDDMTRPVLKAEDKTFGAGFVGFGSFDDTGRFRKVSLYARNTVMGSPDFFQPIRKRDRK